MPLDIFQSQQREADAFIATQPGFGPGLDPSFGEAFGEAMSSLQGTNLGLRVGASKFNAVQTWLDQFQKATGQELQNPEMPSDGATRRKLYGDLQERYASFKQGQPDFAMLAPPTEEQASAAAMDDLRRKAAEEARFAARPSTFASSAGSVLGGFAGAATDPINIASMAVGVPEAAGIVGTALRIGAIAGGSQAVISTLTSPLRGEVGLPVNIPGEVLTAAAGGVLLGGGLKGLGAAWARLRRGPVAISAPETQPGLTTPVEAPQPVSPLENMPRYVRDAGNVVERQAEINFASPYKTAGVDGEMSHAAKYQAAEAAVVKGEAPVIPNDQFSQGTWRPGKVTTGDGKEIGVKYEVVEANTLVASQHPDLSANPAYPVDLQPRDRTRAASSEQIAGMAAKLDPNRLGQSPDAAYGAPIVGPDNVVESGNGRTLAIRRAYAQGTADAYRTALDSQGFDTSGMKEPVLVARRTSVLTDTERADFAASANRASVMRMSAPEQALADARLLGTNEIDKLDSVSGVSAEANRPFVKGFLAKLPKEDRAGMIDRSGALSAEGIRRVEAALLARAYGEPAMLSRILESPDSGVKALGGALTDSAGKWVAMRGEVSRGTIPAGMDITNDLLDAFRMVAKSRDTRTPMTMLTDQADAFSTPSPITRALLKLMFRDEEMTKPASRAAVARGLSAYAEEAAKNTTDARLFGEPLSQHDVLGTALAKAGREDLAPAAEQATLPLNARETLAKPQVDDAVLHQLEHLQEAAPDLKVPVTTFDDLGNETVTMRPVKELIDEADAEIKAAKEIEACATGNMVEAAA